MDEKFTWILTFRLYMMFHGMLELHKFRQTMSMVQPFNENKGFSQEHG